MTQTMAPGIPAALKVSAASIAISLRHRYRPGRMSNPRWVTAHGKRILVALLIAPR
jgi:hypothetical protein